MVSSSSYSREMAKNRCRIDKAKNLTDVIITKGISEL